MSELFGLDNYYYHGSVRRYVALFGSLFSNIYIKRRSDDGTKEDTIVVPLRYGKGNMYLKAAQDSTREVKQVSRILPAMSFQLDNFYKDVSRKTNPMNRIQNPTFDSSGQKTFQFNRIPYNFIFNLEIRTKNTDDMLQIAEQIIPAFDGNLAVSIEDTTGVAIEQDITIMIDEISMEDNFDEEMQSRLVEWKITFEMKGYLYKKTQSSIVVQEASIMTGPNFDDMINLINVIDQDPITDTQLNLSKMTEIVDALPSLP